MHYNDNNYNERRFKEEVAYERIVLHAFRLPHVVSTYRVIYDYQPPPRASEGSVIRRGRLKTVAGTDVR